MWHLNLTVNYIVYFIFYFHFIITFLGNLGCLSWKRQAAARAVLPTLSGVCCLLVNLSWSKGIRWILSWQRGIFPSLLQFPTAERSLTCVAYGTQVRQLIVLLRWTRRSVRYPRQTGKRSTAPSQGRNRHLNAAWIWSLTVALYDPLPIGLWIVWHDHVLPMDMPVYGYVSSTI